MTTSPGLVASSVRAEMARQERTQLQAAHVLRISGQAMSKKARGLTPFKAEELIALAKWLGISVSVLMEEPGAQERTEATPHLRAPLAQPIPV